jgi:hypothetical protein
VKASFSKITGNKTLEFGGVSPSNDLTRYKMESFSGDESREKCPTLGLLKLRGLGAAAISLIAMEGFVIVEEFGQIYS